jgi:hypothetical protein
MSSLKNYCGPLSELLGMTLDGLYERARALTHSGYLSGAAGRGPGSGVRATVPNVTKLLLSTLATDSLSEVDAKTRKLAALKQVDGKCALTGELRFQNALEKILGSPELSDSVVTIDVRREDMSARISFVQRPRQFEMSDFGHRSGPPAPPTRIARLIIARLSGKGAKAIAQDLQDIASGAPPRSETRIP